MARKDPFEGFGAFAEPGRYEPGGFVAAAGQRSEGGFPGPELLKFLREVSKTTRRLILETGRLEAGHERLFRRGRRGYRRRKKETDEWREAVVKLIGQGLKVIPPLLARQAEGWQKVGRGMGGIGGELPGLIQGFGQLGASSQGFLTASIAGFEQHRTLLREFGSELRAVNSSFSDLLEGSNRAGAGINALGEKILDAASGVLLLRDQLAGTGRGLSLPDILKRIPAPSGGRKGSIGLATTRSLGEFAQSTEGTVGSVGAGVAAFLSGGNPAAIELGARLGRLAGEVVKPITRPVVKFFKKIFDEGGMVDFDAGLAFPGQRVLINAQVGEAVLSRRAVAAVGGPAAVESLNRGLLPVPQAGRRETVVHLGPINISGADLSSREHRREVASRLAREIRSELMELERFTFRA